MGSGLSTLEVPQSGHTISIFRVRRNALLSMVETSVFTVFSVFSVFTSFDPLIPATDRDAFRPWSWSLDTTDLSTNENEDPESHIASTFGLKSR